ncbi:Transposase, IS30 family [Paeniglutamicibacter gangotriensis Lz1y]|uniref:Transposase, IS30 family n=1 Tax=Paeniglutamicibacter gangotriensis Lz1y TaxID=1276920 RepID=M7NLZ0_9MICC|nr:Transposase, IS30 family [Paeniglutamicibacter gangotriensis Lz1y]
MPVPTAFDWAYKSGAVDKKPRAEGPSRKYTQAQKDEFFVVLAELDSVDGTAARLGLNRSTCFNWARKHGKSKPKVIPGRKEEYLRLRALGLSRQEAATSVGVVSRTGQRWDDGMVKIDGRYVYPDTPPLAYNLEVTTSFTEQENTSTYAPLGIPAGSPHPTPLAVVEQEISSRYLSVQEWETIADMLSRGDSQRAIARELGRCPGSISREIARNRHPKLGYISHGTHRAAAGRRARFKSSKLAEPGPLRDYVEKMLKEDWSPEQISNCLIKDHPHDLRMRATHETIYQAIYVPSRGGL